MSDSSSSSGDSEETMSDSSGDTEETMSDENTGVDLSQAAILKQLEEDNTRAFEVIAVEFTRSIYPTLEGGQYLCPWWLWVLLLLPLLLIIGLIAGFTGHNLGESNTGCGVDYEEGIVYRLYVNSFTEQGDFDGVKDKLDYIKGLGTKYIVLSQELSRPREQPVDFLELNEDKTGTWDQFKDLVKAAGEKGIRILIEINTFTTTFNSEMFPSNLLVPADENVMYPYGICNILVDNKTFTCLGSPDRPVLDATNPEVKQKYKEILQKWMKYGACGFFIHDMDKVYPQRYTQSLPKDNKTNQEGNENVSSLKDVKEIIDATDGAIIIADIGNRDVYSSDLINKHYEAGASMVFGYKMASVALNEWLHERDVGFHRKHFAEMEKFFSNDNILMKQQRDIPLYITASQSYYSTSEKYKEFYPTMLLLAFTLPGTPVLTAGEEYGRTGFIGEQMDWEKAENNTMFNFIRNLVKIRTNNLFSKYDESYVLRNNKAKVLNIRRMPKSESVYITYIMLHPNGTEPFASSCSENFIVTPNCCKNWTVISDDNECPVTVHELGYLDGMFVNRTKK